MKKKTILLLAIATVLVASSAAFAFTPVAGDLFYEGYDFASKMTKGAGGATVGLAGAVSAGFFLFRSQIMPAGGCALGAILVASATKAVDAFGFLF